jgi:hypothetical protein
MVAFVLLAIVLPLVQAIFTVLLLRFIIRRLGVRLIPARIPRSSMTDKLVGDRS